MIQIIHGKKGSGKTKKILDMAIQSVKTTTGDVVFVDDDARYMYDLPHEVRFVIASEYGVNSPDMCLGFLSGMLTQNFDISIVFVDAFMKLVKVPAEELESFFSRLEAISEAHHVDFVISASVDDAVAPDFLRKYYI